jgi:flagellar biosynthesis/type III secretory pathway M-ring protein FliF/YscJ
MAFAAVASPILSAVSEEATMTMGLLFWILMLLWLLFGLWSNWPNYRPLGNNLLLFILLHLLGWKAFGAPIHG